LADENDDLIDDIDPTKPLDDQPTADDSELETPPEEPAAKAEFYAKKYEAEAARTRELQQDNKRLKGRVEEEASTKQFHFDDAKKLREELRRTHAGPEKQQKPEPEDEDLNIDLAELATADDGGKRLARIIDERATKIAARAAQGAIQNTLNELGAFNGVNSQYPELAKPESEFAKATFAEVAKLKENELYAKTPEAVLTEIAAKNVELNLLREGKTREGKDAAAARAEEARDARIRRQSQPNGKGKPSGDKGAKVEVDPRLARQAEARGLTAKEIAEAYDPKSIVGWQPGA